MYVLIADDHANVRRGLREIVADAFSGAQCSEAANGDEVLTQLAISQYEALLLDINMPERSGLDVLQDVKHMYSVAELRDAYRRAHFLTLIPSDADGHAPPGDWTQPVGSAYDRKLYGFQ